MDDTIPYGLTPVQEKVIAAIAGGAIMQAAATAASIHRNTIGYWIKTSVAFRDALAAARYDKAIVIREEAESRVTEAFAAIHAILTRPDASDSARLNAAKYIIEMASTPPPPRPATLYPVENAEIVPNPAQSPAQNPAAAPPPKSEIVHSSAQSPAQNPAAARPRKPEIVPNPAQSRPLKVGRNEPCPCGSRLKFKRCCLGKTTAEAAA